MKNIVFLRWLCILDINGLLVVESFVVVITLNVVK